jgi:hypothetical protein
MKRSKIQPRLAAEIAKVKEGRGSRLGVSSFAIEGDVRK